MKIIQVIQKLEKEIKGENRKDVIEVLEEQLRENIEELSTNTDFFNFPLNNVFSVISKVNFNELEEATSKIAEIIRNIIKNLINAHSKEKETILILQNLNINSITFTYEDLFYIRNDN